VALDKKISEKRKRQCSKLVALSKDIVRQAFDRFRQDELGITWTGGKDSGLTLWIIRQVCQENGVDLPKAMIIGEESRMNGTYRLRSAEMRMYYEPPTIH